MNPERLTKTLVRDEGFRSKPYRDTVGKLTIGIGRNLDDRGISRDEAEYLLQADIREAVADLNRHLPWWVQMCVPRQEVLLNMCFNMGIGNAKKGLLSFRNTLRYMEEGDYERAASGMLQSKWARQVGARARRLSNVMRTGDPTYFDV